MVRVLPVDHSNLTSFLRYDAAHGNEHDESCLPGARFVPSRDQPAYVLMHNQEILGAVALMRSERYQRARRGRFSILHCVDPTAPRYSLLLDAIRPHCRGLDSVYLFLPEGCPSSEALLQLGFSLERYSYVMEADCPTTRGVVVPEGLTLVPIRPSNASTARLFSRAINANFSQLAGHIPMRPQDMSSWEQDRTYLEDGVALLMAGRYVVGTVSVQRDADAPGAAEIGALSVDAAWRGRGLGRLLLRHGMCFAAWHGLRPVYLSVNAENARALRLYADEGFVVINTMVRFARACDAWPTMNGSDASASDRGRRGH